MVTMLDCIRRVPERIRLIADRREENFSLLAEFLRKETPDEILLIGSGTSYTAAFTARRLAEEASGIRVTVSSPSDFLHASTVRNPHALYVFVSQSGTSAVLLDAMRYVKGLGLPAALVSASGDSLAAKEADWYLDMGAGNEEYGMRTIGYSTSVLTLQLLGVTAGQARGVLSGETVKQYAAQLEKGAEAIPGIIQRTLEWMDHSRRNIMRSRFIAFTGMADLYGVAMEGAVKMWEAPQYPSAGFELDEGMHGPNFGYNDNDALIVLYNGAPGSEKALALARYMKNEHHNGYVFGTETIDEHDLPIQPQGGPFFALEYAAAVQTFMYRLAVDGGRDFSVQETNQVMKSYFDSHIR